MLNSNNKIAKNKIKRVKERKKKREIEKREEENISLSNVSALQKFRHSQRSVCLSNEPKILKLEHSHSLFGNKLTKPRVKFLNTAILSGYDEKIEKLLYFLSGLFLNWNVKKWTTWFNSICSSCKERNHLVLHFGKWKYLAYKSWQALIDKIYFNNSAFKVHFCVTVLSIWVL